MMYKFYVKSSLLLLMTLSMFKLSVLGQEMIREFEPPYRLKDLYQFSVDEFWSVGGRGFSVSNRYKVIKEQEISKQYLYALYFANEKTIFVVGEEEEILVSTDRGKSWEKQGVRDKCCTYYTSQKKVDLKSVFCLHRYKCWAVGIDESGIMGGGFLFEGGADYPQMLKGGIKRVWIKERITSNNVLTDVYFATESVGYIVGAEGLLLKTEDGGESWKRIGVPVGKYVVEHNSIPDFNAVVFIDEERGCIVGDRTISCTQDGGKKWETTYMEGVKDGTYGFEGIFFEKDTIIAVSKYGNHFWSKDFGKTWIECYEGCGIMTTLRPSMEGHYIIK